MHFLFLRRSCKNTVRQYITPGCFPVLFLWVKVTVWVMMGYRIYYHTKHKKNLISQYLLKYMHIKSSPSLNEITPDKTMSITQMCFWVHFHNECKRGINAILKIICREKKMYVNWSMWATLHSLYITLSLSKIWIHRKNYLLEFIVVDIHFFLWFFF